MNPADVPVVILCGGKGTRIRGVSDKVPKPMIPIGPHPILWHIMKSYSAHGFRKFVLCLGYKSWDIKEFFFQYRDMTADVSISTASGETRVLSETFDEDWEVVLAETGLETGTGGRLAAVTKYLDNDYFMCSYGDGIGDVNLAAELDQLVNSDAYGLVCGVHPTSRYGELQTSNGLVTDFAEKLPSDSWVSGGFFAFRKEFLRYLETDQPDHFFEHAPLAKLTADGKLGLFEHDGFWMGMDTFREFTALNEMWNQDSAAWKVWD